MDVSTALPVVPTPLETLLTNVSTSTPAPTPFLVEMVGQAGEPVWVQPLISAGLLLVGALVGYVTSYQTERRKERREDQLRKESQQREDSLRWNDELLKRASVFLRVSADYFDKVNDLSIAEMQSETKTISGEARSKHLDSIQLAMGAFDRAEADLRILAPSSLHWTLTHLGIVLLKGWSIPNADPGYQKDYYADLNTIQEGVRAHVGIKDE
ncbi:hypothetical protein MT356_09455 [Rathayibacter festucae]|uniref:hypothetical protein n=1 Tax=Rathayibacter festucae TaxID=110937 RepID=UPI001FB51C26|nr:hypothetical protein [Rathayibacter festucae]MCJ1699948.1 hypothetical protein [Rathayibacter festucae]